MALADCAIVSGRGRRGRLSPHGSIGVDLDTREGGAVCVRERWRGNPLLLSFSVKSNKSTIAALSIQSITEEKSRISFLHDRREAMTAAHITYTSESREIATQILEHL